MRDGAVSLPPDNTTGQAGFTGKYAGLRIFDGIAKMELTEADIKIDIDFDDFDANNTVKGRLYNRAAYNPDGTAVVLGDDYDAGELPLGDLPFVIAEGVDNFNEDGEIFGSVRNTRLDLNSGTQVEYETGKYYGIMAGDLNDPADGGEIVGIIVIDSFDPRDRIEKQVQETGGFIVYR
jgi:hypothetical protein